MSMIGEQVADLREKALIFENSGCATDGIVKSFRKAADTIEQLSEKLAINSHPPADQWIPCSEPPKKDGMYFITAKVLDKLEVQYVFYQKNLDLFICNGKPIAWMPLPEPFKGEQND